MVRCRGTEKQICLFTCSSNTFWVNIDGYSVNKCRQVQAPTNIITAGRQMFTYNPTFLTRMARRSCVTSTSLKKENLKVTLFSKHTGFISIRLSSDRKNSLKIRSGYAKEGSSLHLHRHSLQSCVFDMAGKKTPNINPRKEQWLIYSFSCYFRKFSDGLTKLIGIPGQMKHLSRDLEKKALQ